MEVRDLKDKLIYLEAEVFRLQFELKKKAEQTAERNLHEEIAVLTSALQRLVESEAVKGSPVHSDALRLLEKYSGRL
jgi:uncharacterized small protein (DUF1192 family)